MAELAALEAMAVAYAASGGTSDCILDPFPFWLCSDGARPNEMRFGSKKPSVNRAESASVLGVVGFGYSKIEIVSKDFQKLDNLQQ